MTRDSLTLHITSEIEGIDAFESELREFLTEHDFPETAIFKTTLTLDEAVTNIISYGYDAPGSHDILVTVTVKDGRMELRIEDNARPFDPNKAPRPELNKAMCDRAKPVGGMGVHLIKSCMDSVDYSRVDEKNVLKMIRDISFEPRAEKARQTED